MKTVIEMAQQTLNRDRLGFWAAGMGDLEAFAALVRADEREKRDEAVALLRKIHMGNESARSQDIIRAAISVLQRNAPEELAAAIRARGKND